MVSFISLLPPEILGDLFGHFVYLRRTLLKSSGFQVEHLPTALSCFVLQPTVLHPTVVAFHCLTFPDGTAYENKPILWGTCPYSRAVPPENLLSSRRAESAWVRS